MFKSSKNKKKRKITPLEMYTDSIIRRLRANSSNIDLNVSGSAKMHLMYDRIVTSTSIKKYYILTKIAQYMPNELISFIRMIEKPEEVIGEGVAVNVCFKMEPYVIDWSSREMSIRSSVWEQDISEAESEVGKGHFVSNEETSIMDNNTWLQKSWRYFQEMCSDGHSTPVLQLYIELCTGVANPRANANLKQAELELLTRAYTNGFELKPVRGNLWDFQRLISPVSAGNPKMEKRVDRFPLTDSWIASAMDYTPGKLTHTESLMGMDIDTGKMVYKDFKSESGGAEVLLIAAITGGGKSFFAKSICINTLLSGYIYVVLDRDGEYIPLANSMNGTVISMSRGSGKYYDSTIIADVTGIPEVDDTLLIDSQNATKAVFNVIADAERGMSSQELAMFNDAYNNLYKHHCIVNKDKSTWCNSRNLTFHKLYKEICELKNDTYYTQRYGNSLLDFIDKLRVFFDEDGVNSYIFKEPISLKSILTNVDGNAPIVVLHMDLRDEDGNSRQDKPTLIKLITTQYLMDTILTHNRQLNRFTFAVIEEFQRYLNNDFAKGIAVTVVTGGRKKNANVIIITNNPDELAIAAETDKALLNIKDNITSAMVGRIKSENSIAPICNNLGLVGCEEEFKDMFLYPESYSHAFVCKFDSMESAIIKAVVPPEFVKSKIFLTRTLKSDANV